MMRVLVVSLALVLAASSAWAQGGSQNPVRPGTAGTIPKYLNPNQVGPSAVTETAPIRHSATLPGTCTLGEVYIDDDASPSTSRVYVCTATNTWTQQSGTPITSNSCDPGEFASGIGTDGDLTCGAPSLPIPGADTQCLFNDGGGLGADAGCTYNKATDTLTVGTLITTSSGASELGSAIQFTNDISPSQLTGNTDNWNPTGLSTASTIRLSTDASRDITGIQGGADGRILILHNVGSFDAVLKNDVTSTAANRFLFGADITLAANKSIALRYDSTSSRWRAVTTPGAAGGAGDMQTNATNTMGASGTIDASGASVTSGIRLPNGAGANPTALGAIAYDTTKDAPVVGQNQGGSSTAQTAYLTRFLNAYGPSGTLDATNGTTQTFDINIPLPANYCVAGKFLKMTVLNQSVTPGSGVSRAYRLTMCTVSGCGSGTVTDIVSTGAVTPNNGATRSIGTEFLIKFTSCGASGTVDVAMIGTPHLATADAAFRNSTSQPVTVDTTVAQFLSYRVIFGATTASNTDTLRFVTWEELN